MNLASMEQMAVPLGNPDLAEEFEYLRNEQQKRWKRRQAELLRSGDPLAAGGQWLHDSRAPFAGDVFPTITLLTTSLMLYPALLWTPTFSTDWFPGKRFWLHAYGTITTAATPGNLTVELRYATTDAGGILLATSAALTLVASQTTIPWSFDGFVVCRDIGMPGANGLLEGYGQIDIGVAVNAAGGGMIPASAPAPVASDTTLNGAGAGISLQFKRSGSTAETATVQDLVLTAMN